LVGDGQRISELRQQVKDKKTLFVGNVTNPLDYIQRFDIACLPSRFSSESLPTVIIEYLQQGKPVIASRVGEIPAMLRIGSGDPAGLVIDLDSESTMADAMAAALRTLADDPVLRGRMSRATRQAFEPFDMDDCARHYEQVYAEVARGG
jgi:glycosyltransferase involved in cell wall biosynthesis